MQDITEPTLARKINSFLCRKAAEFPELHLDANWNTYVYTPRPKRIDYTRKHALVR